MTHSMTGPLGQPAPAYPVGPFDEPGVYSDQIKLDHTTVIRDAAGQLRIATAGLNDSQLDTKYRNWTIRQICHHIADSHLHSLIRFRWALTEDNPLIKAYEEADWVQLVDCQEGAIEPAIAMVDGLHRKWVQMLESMTEAQFGRTFQHPQTRETVVLWTALSYYAWHSRHHTGQILWLRRRNRW